MKNMQVSDSELVSFSDDLIKQAETKFKHPVEKYDLLLCSALRVELNNNSSIREE